MMNPENWDDKAVVALSSGKGPVAISVIRISGFSCLTKFSHFFSRNLSSCLLYTSPSPRDRTRSRMPSSA